MEEKSKNRIVWLDQLRAVAMFIVVLGHSELPSDTIKFIYSFHMPLFFIISGITFNPYRYKAFADRVKDKFYKLIVPHFWMNIMMLPLWIYTFKILSQAKPDLVVLLKGIFYINSGKYQSPSNATYFLAVLFLTELLFWLVWKWSKDNKQMLVLAVCVLGLIGFIESKNSSNYEGPWHVEAVFTAVVFYMLGYFLKQYLPEIEKFLQSKKNWLILCICCIVVGAWCSNENGRVSLNGNSYDSIIYFYTAAILISAFIIMVVMKLPAWRPLVYIGQNTIAYVGIHIPLIRLAQKLFPSVMDDWRRSVLLAVAVYLVMIPITWIVNRFFPFVLSKPRKQESTVPRRVISYGITCAGIAIWFVSLLVLLPYVL